MGVRRIHSKTIYEPRSGIAIHRLSQSADHPLQHAAVGDTAARAAAVSVVILSRERAHRIELAQNGADLCYSFFIYCYPLSTKKKER